MPITRLGLLLPNFDYGIPNDGIFERVSLIARSAEESGFDSLWVMDHFYQIASYGKNTAPMLEAYSLLGAVAARTNNVRLGTLVSGATYRNPALLAKMVTTLDVISSGRAILGIGAASNREEHEAYGFGFPPTAERMGRLEDALQICRAMFTREAPSYRGRYSSISDALNFPRPVQSSIPILVGGVGERRTLRLVAQYADACNLYGDVPTARRRLEVLNGHCEAIGRDPAEVTKTWLGTLILCPTSEEAERATRAEATRLGISQEQFKKSAVQVVAGTPEQVSEQLQRYFDIGFDGLLFNLPEAHHVESVIMAGETLTKAFALGDG